MVTRAAFRSWDEINLHVLVAVRALVMESVPWFLMGPFTGWLLKQPQWTLQLKICHDKRECGNCSFSKDVSAQTLQGGPIKKDKLADPTTSSRYIFRYRWS